MEPKVPDLYEFLTEAELQQYYNSLKNELKITNVTHLKYTTDEDLRQVSGLSRPEIRRLRKYYEKYYPHGYLNKIRRLLQTPRRDDSNFLSCVPAPSYGGAEAMTSNSSPNKIPNNKHIIPPDAICVNKQLGTGEFGIVQQGVWTNGSERIQVAIKCLCRERMQSNPMEFLKEAAMMHSIEHENIVRLYGVVLDTESLMLVTELAHLRSLLECLKDPGLRVSFLTVPTLCEFSLQICTGMMYLESKRFIHRDLAARNILVFNKNKVKISDFGLSRALGVGKDYYQTNFNVNLKLPIAWCAPECINFLRFTHASDVWAYGVCLWEIFSYGFQPWAALTGHQILEAIDEPHYQRLEKPECCPKEYYSMMLKCWQHDATKRPKFNDIFQALPDIKPEQLKTIVANSEQKKDYLMYRQGEIITVLDKNNNSPYWKGVLNSGKTGLFNPANTVAYLDSLPSSVNRESLCRTAERSSKRKIRTDMISRPQNDLKHTGHVGIDGVSFGDVAFLSSPQNLPRQIVTPYKPSEDLEQTPLLLPPTPTSPDSIQTASGYFSETLQLSGHTSFINAGENHHPHVIDHTSVAGLADAPVPAALSAFDFRNNGFNDSNPFINADDNGDTTASVATTYNKDEHNQHEYHEISDDDMVTEKVLDQGPSLMDEMEHVFKSMSTISEQQPATPFSLSSSQDTSENSNMRNELTELSEKLGRKNSCSASGSATLGKSGGKSKSKHKTSTVKPISVKDEKLLNQAIEMANEISAKSMTDLVTDVSQQTMSPKRKFSFRFPHIHNVVAAGSDGLRCTSNGNITGNQSHVAGMSSVGSSSHAAGGRGLMPDKDHSTLAYAGQHHPHSSNAAALANSYREKRNFSQEVNNVPDLQRYCSLTEIESYQNRDIKISPFDKESSDFCFKKSRELLSKQPPFRVANDMASVSLASKINYSKTLDKKTRELIGENLLDIEKTLNALNLDFLQTYHELEKADSAETLFAECYSTSMICSSSSSPYQKSPPSGSLMRRTASIQSQSTNARINSALSEKVLSGSSSILGGKGSPPKMDGGAGGFGMGAGLGGGATNTGSGINRCHTQLNGGTVSLKSGASSTTAAVTPQSDHGNKYSIRDFKMRSLEARSKERSDYYNFKNEYLSELTRKQQSQVLDTATILQQTNGAVPAGDKQQQHSKISQLYQIYNTPSMQARLYDDCPYHIPSSCSSVTAAGTSTAAAAVAAARQRSLSFTENYELRKPFKSGAGPHSDSQQQPGGKMISSRNVITCKPRSIRARNLRRLSYNPINMIHTSSSSSSSDSDQDRRRNLLAHSECDIRTRLHTTTASAANRRRRHQQYMSRKSNSNSASSQDKLYGSNASIKSAPQYNHSDRHQYYNSYQHHGGTYHHRQNAYDDDADDLRQQSRNREPKGGANVYDFGVSKRQLLPNVDSPVSTTVVNTSTSCSLAGSSSKGVVVANSPPGAVGASSLVNGMNFSATDPPASATCTNKALERDYLYSEFDVSKLTGKSPTTQSYFSTTSAPGAVVAPGQQPATVILPSATAKTAASATPLAGATIAATNLQAQPQPGFQWPEKIHGALVKHNDMLWQRQQTAGVRMYGTGGVSGAGKNERTFSSDTSSTETDSIGDFRNGVAPVNCLPSVRPPSPAP
ncbi:uncharacterized protein LOC128724484 [Anopheles nili]|uniref:uncharacterized protein LOC128724484 n=1 Tax=Anopheles nili TaxID=185578 RepID=UPI00237B7C35|nr:uncharacterized protein LOC128724484 [Anopheles nili]